MSEEMISVAEAAERLGVHRTRVNQLIAAGKLPAQRIGRSYAVRVADLELVEERPAPGRPPQQAEAKASVTRPGRKQAAKKKAMRR